MSSYVIYVGGKESPERVVQLSDKYHGYRIKTLMTMHDLDPDAYEYAIDGSTPTTANDTLGEAPLIATRKSSAPRNPTRQEPFQESRAAPAPASGVAAPVSPRRAEAVPFDRLEGAAEDEDEEPIMEEEEEEEEQDEASGRGAAVPDLLPESDDASWSGSFDGDETSGGEEGRELSVAPTKSRK